jgi:AcrR family transcriptional regulator
MAVVDVEGADALTLASIAKSMGMSAPGLYRYFPSRDALLDELRLVAHRQLAHALSERATKTTGLSARERFDAVIDAYRAWALAHPKRYEMMSVDQSASGRFSDELLTAIYGGMDVLIGALVELGGPTESVGVADDLEAGLRDWFAQRSSRVVPPRILRAAVFTWTRLHGIVSLEVSGAFAAMGIDPRLLIEAEIEAVLAGSRPVLADSQPLSHAR